MDGFRFALAKKSQKETTNEITNKNDNYNFSSLKIPLEISAEDRAKATSAPIYVPTDASDIATPDSMRKTTPIGKAWNSIPTPESHKSTSLKKPWPWSSAWSAPSSESIVIRDTSAEERATPGTSAPTKKKRKNTVEMPDPPPETPKSAINNITLREAIRSSELSLLSAMMVLAEEKEKLKTDLGSRQLELVRVRGELADKGSSMKELHFKISNLMKLLDNLNSEEILFRQNGDSFKASLRELTDECFSLKAEIATRKADLDAIKRDESEYYRQHQNHVLLKTRAEELVGQLSEERDRVVSLESDMSNLRIELKKYTDSEKEGLVQDLTKREIVENEINERLAGITSRVSKWNTDITLEEISQELRSAISQTQKLQAEALQLHQKHFEERLITLQKEKEDLNTVITSNNERLAVSQVESAKGKSKLQETALHIQRLETIICGLETEKKRIMPEDELPIVKQLRGKLTDINQSLLDERKQSQSLREQNDEKAIQHNITSEELSKAREIACRLEQDLDTALLDKAASRNEGQRAVQAEVAAHEGRLRREFNLEIAEYQNRLKQHDNKISQLQSQLALVKVAPDAPKITSIDPNERILATPEDASKKSAFESATFTAIGDIEKGNSPNEITFTKQGFELIIDKKTAGPEQRKKSITYTAQPRRRRGLRNGS